MRLFGLLLVVLLLLTACSSGGSEGTTEEDSAEVQAAQAGEDPGETVELQRSWESTSVVESPGGASAASVAVSRAFFVTSPAVVLAPADDRAAVDEGAQAAAEAGVPLLLFGGAASPSSSNDDDAASTSAGPADRAAGTVEEVRRLEAERALLVGERTTQTLESALDIEVVSRPDELPALQEVEGLSDLAVLVLDDDDVEPATRTAATATATAAGATVLTTTYPDVRADPELVSELADSAPDHVVGIGAPFGPADQLASRVELAKTGVQLPGGGQTLFPGRRLVALYGTPGTPGLGVLGEQDLEATIERARDLAAEYEPLTQVPVVPTLEIIATVAQGAPGADGDYSGEVSVDTLRPWVERAGEEGVYVVLDLQPGRSSFLDQARRYEELLRMPHVGLALDPEWRLAPDEVPLGQIGRVQADEVNSVITWLADLTEQESLPQKLLVLHQFRISMLPDSQDYDLSRDEVRVLVHMDGQGPTGDKEKTWAAVTEAAPDRVPFGWKNFYDEDIPMLSPAETMDREPVPFMVSYQ